MEKAIDELAKIVPEKVMERPLAQNNQALGHVDRLVHIERLAVHKQRAVVHLL